MENSQLAVAPSSAYGRRLSVNVALDVGQAIDELGKRHGTTITDVIRRAVSTYKFVDDEVAAGGDPGGTERDHPGSEVPLHARLSQRELLLW